MSVTKIELAEMAYEHLRVDKKTAAELVDLFFEDLKNGLAKDGVIQISGFGKFLQKQKRERKGRNPQPGAGMTIGERKVVSFHHSQVLKERLNSKKS